MLDKSDNEEVVIRVGVAEPFVVVVASSAAAAVGVVVEDESAEGASEVGSLGSMPFCPTAAAGGDTASAGVREDGAVGCEETGLLLATGGEVVGEGAGAAGGGLGFAAEVATAAAGGGAAILVAVFAFAVVAGAGGGAMVVSTDAAAMVSAASAAGLTADGAGNAVRERVQRLPLKIVVESGGVAMQRTDS
jgi:hypothetical protein